MNAEISKRAANKLLRELGDRALTPQPGPQQSFLESVADIAIYGGAAGSGKALSLETPLATADGWTTMGAVKEGDCLFDEGGRTCKVTAVHDVIERPDSYRVTFSDGTWLDACADHQWHTFDAKDLASLTRRNPEWRAARRAKRKSRATGNNSAKFVAAIAVANAERGRRAAQALPSGAIRTTAEIAVSVRTASGRANHAIPLAKALDLPGGALPLDPYVLGAWLGDGVTITGRMSAADTDVIGEIEKAGFETRKVPSAKYGYRIIGLTAVLRDVGLLGHKHVPQAYLRASAEQRFALLQGLMDTDGTCAKSGACEFTTTSPALRDGMAELLATLGIKSNWNESRALLYGKDCGPRWRFTYTTPTPVFRLPRKLARQCRDGRRTAQFRYIVRCERIAPVRMRCISVDSPSHLYLAGPHMVPTHNSFALLLEPLKHIDNAGFGAVYFRRSSVQIRNEGGLWDESVKLYPIREGIPNSRLFWKFPTGATISFAHLEYDKTVLDWHGSQICLICMDELTHFSAYQFWYMVSRNRSTCGIRPYMRSTCNPDADSWVADLISWWIDQDTGYPILSRAGVLRWFVRVGDKLIWADHPEELVGYTMPLTGDPIPPTSLTFIPGRLSDNQALIRANPSYEARLLSLPPVERERLLYGNWKIRHTGRAFFDLQALLVDGQPVQPPKRCDEIFAVIDSATKTGKANDATAVVWCARTKAGAYPHPVAVLDWDTIQLEGSLLEAWLPSVLQRGQELARQCGARRGFVGVWIEDKDSGQILLQQARRKELPAYAIDSKVTGKGKDERALGVSGYVYNGQVKLTEHAFHKTVDLKGVSKNHMISQIENFQIADPAAAKRADDLLDAWVYAIVVALETGRIE